MRRACTEGSLELSDADEVEAHLAGWAVGSPRGTTRGH
jgi:hypothetical protein